MTLQRTDEEWRTLATTLKHRLGNLRKAYRELQRTYQLRNQDFRRAADMHSGSRRQATEWWEKWRLANDEIARRDAEIRALKDQLLLATAPTWQRMVSIMVLVALSVILGAMMGFAYR